MEFSGDAFRYYFMRECPFVGDGEFSFARFANCDNGDLANNLGNLVSRVSAKDTEAIYSSRMDPISAIAEGDPAAQPTRVRG